jgi:hypothetical protein
MVPRSDASARGSYCVVSNLHAMAAAGILHPVMRRAREAAIFEDMTLRSILVTGLLLTALVGGGCGDGRMGPSESAIVTFRIGNETFRVHLVDDQIEAARRAQAGGAARIPNGRIVAGTSVNANWSWHLEDFSFAVVTIEVCDGRPSDVEREGVQFGGGRFCPWSATVASIIAD